MGSSVSEEGKIYVREIAWATKENGLKDYFSKFGEVTRADIVRRKDTGLSKGFGFVVFSDPTILDSVLGKKHIIDGRKVEVTKATSREQPSSRFESSNGNNSRNSGGLGNFRTRRIFVGGLPSTLTKEEFEHYFQDYGCISHSVIHVEQHTGRRRGFGFITFDTKDAVDRVLKERFHKLKSKLVGVEKAIPKKKFARDRNFNSSGSSGTPNITFNSQMESTSRLLPPQPAAGVYLPYFIFGAPMYGYGLANNSALFGCFSPVCAFGSYGSFASDSALAVAYDNQTATNTGFANNNAGLGALGHYYMNAGCVYTAPWTTVGSNASTGQSSRSTATSGNNSDYGSEGSYNDSGRNETLNRHRGNIQESSNASRNPAETVHHGASEGFKQRTCDRNNDSSRHPDAA